MTLLSTRETFELIKGRVVAVVAHEGAASGRGGTWGPPEVLSDPSTFSDLARTLFGCWLVMARTVIGHQPKAQCELSFDCEYEGGNTSSEDQENVRVVHDESKGDRPTVMTMWYSEACLLQW